FRRFFILSVVKNVNAIRRGQDVDLRELITEKRIEERRLSRFHFTDDDKEERLADVAQQCVERVELLAGALHFRRELDQSRESRFELAFELQISVGDHAGKISRGGWKRAMSILRGPISAGLRVSASGKVSAAAEFALRSTQTPSRI